MTIGKHLAEFGGLPAFDFVEPGSSAGAQQPVARSLPAADSVAWRVGVDSYDSQEPWTDRFARFVSEVDTTAVRSLIVGCWTDAYDKGPEPVIEALVAAADRLPALRALFLADITYEECEISWINQGLVTPLLEAFPALEWFGVRGGQELRFPAVRHERLRELVVQTGGMPADAVRGIAASDLPALTHLDLWLGTSEYGGDSAVEDLAPILTGALLPSLKHLALRNSEMQDEICLALASAPVVARLDSLDVSMGVLTDDGAVALLSGQPLTHLSSLDMHHNYLSAAMRTRLTETLGAAGVTLSLSDDGAESDIDEDDEDDEDGEVWRFVAVGE
ncbi:STM4015 family protein [Nocardia jejuensis]|uniref:STM4015 family protein n=1 Tax=Nocardia jejuensis TaxID=328049 RepID=UPI0008337DFD|nr:STM4015 family protein [Nocardia jejuensis]